MRHVKIEIKTIDLRELGVTDESWINGFIRYFRDVYLYASVFEYCENDYFCRPISSYYYTHFWIYNTRLGRCYNLDDFQYYFYGYYNELLQTRRVPSEAEVEQKILNFYKNYLLDIMLDKPLEIKIFRLYNKERVIWIVRLPDTCFS